MSEPLYEITNDILELQQIELDGDESLEEAIRNSLEGLEMEFYDKTDNIVKLINKMDSDTLTIDNEIKRLQTRKVTVKNHTEGIKKYLLEEMQKLDKKSIKTPLFSVTSMKGREVVVIDNESELSSGFIKIDVIEKPDKKLLLSALKEAALKDIVIAGAHIERNPNTLRIK